MLNNEIKSKIKDQYLVLELSQKIIYNNVRPLGATRKEVRSYIDEFRVNRVNKNLNKGLTKATSEGLRKTLEKRKNTLKNKITVCNKEYWTLEKRQAHSKSIKIKGKNGGYRQGSGIGKKSWHIKFDNEKVFCDSTYEVRFLKILDYFKIKSIKVNNSTPDHHIKYYLPNGNTSRYYPDFYLPEFNVYVETKGYITNSTFLKHEAASKLCKIHLVQLKDLIELEILTEVCDKGCQTDSKSVPP